LIFVIINLELTASALTRMCRGMCVNSFHAWLVNRHTAGR
jgi:hypothetical protein